MAFGIVVSRTLGVVREQVLAFYFGGGVLADAWGAATRIPGALQSLLGEGTLSASFVPVYARLLQQGREHEAARVARSVLGLLAAAAGFLALAGYLAAPWLVALFASGFDEGRGRDDHDLVAVVLSHVGGARAVRMDAGNPEQPRPLLHGIRGAGALERVHRRGRGRGSRLGPARREPDDRDGLGRRGGGRASDRVSVAFRLSAPAGGGPGRAAPAA